MYMILVGLFIVCTLYAAGLHQIRAWYSKHNLVWLTVVIGDGIVWTATYLAAQQRVTETAMDSVVFHLIALIVAGTPIIVWQVWDAVKREATIKKRRGGRNGTTDTQRW